ncbi:Detected protein of confused Function [Hibiscus syriacus]|uniref:Detected protein of confused Function n=1 Tax=Hibiscus syriacus TaxID=106335 RepID=A0A6A3CVS5_HIBSY|nr:Detected protein of confused Function [Hibiscus syriacus]
MLTWCLLSNNESNVKVKDMKESNSDWNWSILWRQLIHPSKIEEFLNDDILVWIKDNLTNKYKFEMEDSDWPTFFGAILWATGGTKISLTLKQLSMNPQSRKLKEYRRRLTTAETKRNGKIYRLEIKTRMVGDHRGNLGSKSTLMVLETWFQAKQQTSGCTFECSMEKYNDIVTALTLSNYLRVMYHLDSGTNKVMTMVIIQSITKNYSCISTADKVEVMFGLIKGLIKDIDGADVEEIICIVRKHTMAGGPKRLPFTVSSLVFTALRLVRQSQGLEGDVVGEDMPVTPKKNFQLLTQITLMVLSDDSLSAVPSPELALRLYLQCVEAANGCDLEHLAYEFEGSVSCSASPMQFCWSAFALPVLLL